MFLNSEMQAVLDAAKAKINDHTRQAAGDLAAAGEVITAAQLLLIERKTAIAERRRLLDEEEREAEWAFYNSLREGLTQIETVRQGMRDEQPKTGATPPDAEPGGNVAPLPKRKGGFNG